MHVGRGAMNVCLSHESALACLRCPETRRLTLPDGRRECRAPNRARGDVSGLRCPSPADAREICRRHAPDLALPLDVLVADAAHRRPSQLVRPHVMASPLRRRWLEEQPDGLYACGPELCVAQMATARDAVGLIELASELCGSYSPAIPGVRPTTYGLEPLTCVKRLGRELASMRADGRLVKGARLALDALRHVSDGSASPRETHQAMMLCLPPAMGGCGLERPLLNYRLDVTGRARDVTDSPFYVCDAYWPRARLDVEYDSDEYHTGAGRIARDARRRSALLAMGVTVVTVTAAQMRDAREFDHVARVIAGCLGARMPPLTPEVARRRKLLRRRLQDGPR